MNMYDVYVFFYGFFVDFCRFYFLGNFSMEGKKVLSLIWVLNVRWIDVCCIKKGYRYVLNFLCFIF